MTGSVTAAASGPSPILSALASQLAFSYRLDVWIELITQTAVISLKSVCPSVRLSILAVELRKASLLSLIKS